MNFTFQPSDFTYPPLPRGWMLCIRCGEHYDPDDFRQCPACYAPCQRCGDWLRIEDMEGNRCGACIEEERE